jgi:hypothetical protein
MISRKDPVAEVASSTDEGGVGKDPSTSFSVLLDLFFIRGTSISSVGINSFHHGCFRDGKVKSFGLKSNKDETFLRTRSSHALPHSSAPLS